MNVIAGSSDNGKSSIIRAIRWVVMNRPTGFAFHKHGAKADTAVVIKFSDEECITRDKGEKSSGGYHYKGNVFAALRTDVPPEIQRALNLSDINIQSQHDPYFLLQDSPGEVAKKLNVVAGLGIIGDTIKNANAVVRQRKDAVGALIQQETEYKTDFDKLHWVYEENETATLLEADYKQLQKVDIFIDALENLLRDYRRYTSIIARIKPKIEGWKKELAGIQEEFDEYQRALMGIENLKDIYYQKGVTEHKLNVANKLVKMKPSLEIVNTMVEELLDAQKKTSALESTITEYSRCKASIINNKTFMVEYRKKLDDFKRLHPVCPTCNRPWEEE